MERERRDRDSQKRGSTESAEAGATLTDEEISRIIVDAQKTYPNIKLETQDANHSLLVGDHDNFTTISADTFDRHGLSLVPVC